MDSQLELRVFHDCLDEWEAIISGIRSETNDLRALPGDRQRLRRIAAKLGRICLEADAWGFDDLHHIALRTQQLVCDLRLGALPWEKRTLDYLQDALAMLSSVLPQCEKEFRRRQSTSNMLRLMYPEGSEPSPEGAGPSPKNETTLSNPHATQAR
jgi:chemotaxis protein histidine kinase CheA